MTMTTIHHIAVLHRSVILLALSVGLACKAHVLRCLVDPSMCPENDYRLSTSLRSLAAAVLLGVEMLSWVSVLVGIMCIGDHLLRMLIT